MRTVKIPNCEYPLFEKIRDIYLKHMPWAILKETYSKELKLAIFTFNDSRYIAAELDVFMLEPPANMDLVNVEIHNFCSEELTTILTSATKNES
ncbi:MAG: hypothetical protein KAQ99_00785 [Candidatus Aureabacteria bacterium]|nr:hypothetical protein [Candidatus Auribacterota bacterium]